MPAFTPFWIASGSCAANERSHSPSCVPMLEAVLEAVSPAAGIPPGAEA